MVDAIVDRTAMAGGLARGDRLHPGMLDDQSHFSSDVKARPEAPFDVDRVISLYKSGRSSAHFVIDRKGGVFRLVDPRRVAFHSGKGKLPVEPHRENILNETSIGIEFLAVGTQAEMNNILTKSEYAKIVKVNIGFT